MSKTLSLAPAGRLRLTNDPDAVPAVPDELATSLEHAFAQSNAEGFLLLASKELEGDSHPAIAFWQSWSRRLFQELCHLGEGSHAKWAAVPSPAEPELERLVADAPPMRGLEYLNVELLKHSWEELRELVATRAASFPDGPGAFLQSVNPVWHLLGRVTFHLAENKRDEARPFAFLATYTHQMGDQGQVQHLPLGEALRAYAGAKDQAKLTVLLEPVRRASQRSVLIRELLDSRALFTPQAWTIQQAHRFLMDTAAIEEAGVVVRVPNWWTAQRSRPQVQVVLGSKQASQVGADSLLDFQVGVALDGEPLTETERKELLAGTEGLMLLRGKWIEVDRERLQEALKHWKKVEREHLHGIDFIKGMRLLAGVPLDEADSGDTSVTAWTGISAGDWLKQTLERIRKPSEDAACRPGRDLQATLRPYQAEGVNWLWFMTELGLGACLADDMGLGKTIQIIDLLLQRKRSKATGPSLLVVPASLIGNWKNELARFSPTLKVCVVHGSEADAGELARRTSKPATGFQEFDLVITTYGLVRRQDWLQQVPWSLIVLDEAQAIKNAGSAQTRNVKKISAKGRIVLTGTPVENHLGDLWSLFDFCCPGLLGTATQFKKFVKRLNASPEAGGYGPLRRLVRPYILRRMKTDPAIAPDLPEKTEMRVECGLSKKQAAVYQVVVEELEKRLESSEGIARRGLVLSTLMQMKQICNHPSQFLNTKTFPASESGKFERLRALGEEIAARQEKMLVFTQFQALTQPLADFLAGVFGQTGLVLHGGTPIPKRTEFVKQFQSDDGPPFFVISLKAGGSGLNLTAASHVVHFDRWWNPAVENQATDRAFRIGQKRNVLVHKFVCRGTVEERIDAMIQAKQKVADQILNQEGEAPLTEMSDAELLRFVALDLERATSDD
ncbi:MAG: DEAD/DEAH box helicase [Gemmataceae bacterium]|nr:DEAD/DEAH box helicase [Gemmataceae bacterium]